MADWFQTRALMLTALRSGGVRNGLTSIEWDVSGNCTDPRLRIQRARPYRYGDGNIKGISLEVALTVRCRRCDKCRQIRRRVWSARARAEVQTSARTWFVTLTLRPEEQYKFLAMARQRADHRTEDFDKLTYADQFTLRHNAISPEITKYLKRIRSESEAPIRYLLVAEAHKSGAPHYHMLIHELDQSRPITHRCITGQWPLGFTNAKLVTDGRMATYLCKYLSKSNAARVRASLRYGRNEPDASQGQDIIPALTSSRHSSVF